MNSEKFPQFDFLGRAREKIAEASMPLSDSTLGEMENLLKEYHDKFLNEGAEKFSRRKKKLPPRPFKETAPEKDFFKLVVKEEPKTRKEEEEGEGIKNLKKRHQEKLRRTEILQSLLEARGEKISIGGRALFLRWSEDRIKELKQVIRETLRKAKELRRETGRRRDFFLALLKLKEIAEEAQEKIFKIRDLQLDLISETLGVERSRLIKEKVLERKKKTKSKNKYLGKKIRKALRGFERSKGGFKELYKTEKQKLIEEVLGGKKRGLLDLDIDEGKLKTEEDIKKTSRDIVSRLLGKEVPKEEIDKTWKKYGKEILKWGGGMLGILCMLIIGALIGIVALEFGAAGLMAKKIEGKKK